MSAGLVVDDEAQARMFTKTPIALFDSFSAKSPKTESEQSLIETETSEPIATGSQSKKKAAPATGRPAVKKTPKKKAKLPDVSGCYWTSDWKLRRTKRDDKGNNPFIAQLSDGKFKELKADAKTRGISVATILTEWAETTAAEKGIQL